MGYKCYKMTFHSAHFGQGHLDSSSDLFTASRLFSALFLEAMKFGLADDWLQLAESADFAMSDAMPYYDETPLIPKPLKPLKRDKTGPLTKSDRSAIKKAKSLSHLYYDCLADYLDGDVIESDKISQAQSITKKRLDPYQVGTVTYGQRVEGEIIPTSLYVVATQSPLFDQLMTSLQYAGIGGKRSAGYGQFTLEILDLPDDYLSQLTLSSDEAVMLLTTSLPQDEELALAMDEGYYLLSKASGFAFSSQTASNYRKQDFYSFKAGSSFSSSFSGSIRDVRPAHYPHPVWHYAKPLFYRLEDQA